MGLPEPDQEATSFQVGGPVSDAGVGLAEQSTHGTLQDGAGGGAASLARDDVEQSVWVLSREAADDPGQMGAHFVGAKAMEIHDVVRGSVERVEGVG